MAWTRFVELYTPLMCHWARKIGVPNQDVDDFVQDVFTVLVKDLPVFDYDQARRFRGWLWTVTINKWNERQRKFKVPSRSVELTTDPPDSRPDPSDEMIDSEYRTMIIRQASQLISRDFEPETWSAFCQFMIDDKPAREVARALQMSENAVYLAKARVLRRLREELSGIIEMP